MRNGNTNKNDRNFIGNFSQQQQQQQSNYWPSQVPGQRNLQQPRENRLNANDLWSRPLQPGDHLQASENPNLWNSKSSSMQTSFLNNANSSRNAHNGRNFDRSMPPTSFPMHGGSSTVPHQQNAIAMGQNGHHKRERGHQSSVNSNDVNVAFGTSLANNSNNLNAQRGNFSGNDISSQSRSDLAPSVAALFKAFESSTDSRDIGQQQMLREQQIRQQQHQGRLQQHQIQQQQQQHTIINKGNCKRKKYHFSSNSIISSIVSNGNRCIKITFLHIDSKDNYNHK